MSTKIKRTIIHGVGGILLLVMLGIVGAIEGETIGLYKGFFLALACLAGAHICFHI